MPKGKPMAAVEVKLGWILDIDDAERTVQNYRFRAPKEDEVDRRMSIWFTDGYQVSGDENQTVYVVSEGDIAKDVRQASWTAALNGKTEGTNYSDVLI